MEALFVDRTFEGETLLALGEYENCVFLRCDLSNADLGGIKFSECTFTACNLSTAKLQKTALRDVQFKECKMLGMRFDTCHEFGLAFGFVQCQLNHSSFYRTKIKKTIFRNCSLEECDFSDSDLTEAVFDSCNLLNATFERTILEGADLRTSYDYRIDPESSRIRKAKFSLPAVTGLLTKYDIRID